MSVDPNKFGLTPSLVETVKEALKGNQHKIDVAEPKGKITSADFKKLRGENAKPDFLDLDKDGNKKEPMKHAAKQAKEEVEQVDELSKKTLGSYIKKASDSASTHTGAAAAYGSSSKSPDAKKMAQHQAVATKRKMGINTAVSKLTKEETVVEADDAIAKQLAAKKDAMKKQIQQKIAQKQMSTMQAKANKRLSSINASNDKCSCGSTNESKMRCEVHGDKADKSKGIKGGKEKIEVNPPLREASDLPKSVVKKGHEIAKSLIKHRAKVKEPYAVGMATAKKSAGIKEEVDIEEAVKTGNEAYGYHGSVKAKDDAERAKKYSAMHAKTKKLVGAAGHLKDAKTPNKMVKHFLDSQHGRHIADDPSDRNITSRFGHFKKSYKPEAHD